MFVLFGIVGMTFSMRCYGEAASEQGEAGIRLERSIKRPETYFVTHPKHVIPEDMLIQGFEVHYEPKLIDPRLDAETLTYNYEILQAQGSPKLGIVGSAGKFSSRPDNYFIADKFGENLIKVTVKDKDGRTTSVTDRVFVHFSHVKIAGGSLENLDWSKKESDHFIKGTIQGGELTYKGLRYFPANTERMDLTHESGKYGFYYTKEPRLFYSPSSGVLLMSYHANVEGSNDAPPGMAVVVARSTDRGNTWKDEQIIAHHHNAVWAYTSFIEYEGVVQMYLGGGHVTHMENDHARGVHRIVSEDHGETWSRPEPMRVITRLLNGKPDIIGHDQHPVCNGLTIENMEWKGKRGTAILVPFNVRLRILISMDGGESWDVFFDGNEHPDISTLEINLTPLDNGEIYMASRRQSTEGFKDEYHLNRRGEPSGIHNQTRKNHLARRCHHGATKILDGDLAGHVVLVSHFTSSPSHVAGYTDKRKNATVAISLDKHADSFETRHLSWGGGWGYCEVVYIPEDRSLFTLGECGPIDPEKNIYAEIPGRPERLSISGFKFSLDFYKTLVKCPHSK